MKVMWCQISLEIAKTGLNSKVNYNSKEQGWWAWHDRCIRFGFRVTENPLCWGLYKQTIQINDNTKYIELHMQL